METKREELDRLGRARPTLWSKYSTSSLVIKIMQDKAPENLYEQLKANSFMEKRKQGLLRFFDTSRTRTGLQAIQNELGDLFKQIDFVHSPWINNDQLRINLKENFGFSNTNSILHKPAPETTERDKQM